MQLEASLNYSCIIFLLDSSINLRYCPMKLGDFLRNSSITFIYDSIVILCFDQMQLKLYWYKFPVALWRFQM